MIRAAILAAALWAAFAVVAGAAPPASSPHPLPRPDLARADDAPVVAGVPPRPRPRPGSLAEVVMGPPAHAAPVPALRPLPRPAAAQRSPVMQAAAYVAALPPTAGTPPPLRPDNLRRLSNVHAVGYRVSPAPEVTTGRKGSVCGIPILRGRKIPAITGKMRGCGLSNGVEVTSVGGVALSTPAQVDCRTATALAVWVERGLKPSVGDLGGGVAALEVGPSYACRPRNNQKGQKVSEHGRGAALDIMGIRLANGVVLSVLGGWGTAQQGRVLKALHAAACGPFTTVLGPAANSFHRNHFHFDTAQGRGPYCR
jgi:hypothetical protein